MMIPENLRTQEGLLDKTKYNNKKTRSESNNKKLNDEIGGILAIDKNSNIGKMKDINIINMKRCSAADFKNFIKYH